MYYSHDFLSACLVLVRFLSLGVDLRLGAVAVFTKLSKISSSPSVMLSVRLSSRNKGVLRPTEPPFTVEIAMDINKIIRLPSTKHMCFRNIISRNTTYYLAFLNAP